MLNAFRVSRRGQSKEGFSTNRNITGFPENVFFKKRISFQYFNTVITMQTIPTNIIFVVVKILPRDH